MKRRIFLRNGLALTAACLLGFGTLFSRIACAMRPDAAFLARTVEEALARVIGSSAAIPSDRIMLDAPLQAENGAVVPIEVSTTLPAPESIAVVVPKNPTPLLSVIETTPRTGTYFRMRIKMAGTDQVMVYVKSGGQWYVTSQQVRVAIGGCGG